MHAAHRRLSGPLAILLALGLLASTARDARAQSPPDFLLQRPTNHLDLSFGFALPRADGPIFDFVSERFTVDSGDFRSPTVSGALGFRVTERIDFALEAGYAGSEVRSEYLEYVEDGQPIEQTTRFTRVPFGAVLRIYPVERGRTVGSFAWIPRDMAPYLGLGGGWVWSRFEQEGDFVDERGEPPFPIFTDRLRSTDAAPAFHVLGGVDVSLGPRFVLTGEGRYSWASAELDPSVFRGFGDLDLSGFQATVGMSVRW